MFERKRGAGSGRKKPRGRRPEWAGEPLEGRQLPSALIAQGAGMQKQQAALRRDFQKLRADARAIEKAHDNRTAFAANNRSFQHIVQVERALPKTADWLQRQAALQATWFQLFASGTPDASGVASAKASIHQALAGATADQAALEESAYGKLIDDTLVVYQLAIPTESDVATLDADVAAIQQHGGATPSVAVQALTRPPGFRIVIRP